MCVCVCVCVCVGVQHFFFNAYFIEQYRCVSYIYLLYMFFRISELILRSPAGID